jgi:hypothetical protein
MVKKIMLCALVIIFAVLTPFSFALAQGRLSNYAIYATGSGCGAINISADLSRE